MQFRGNGRKEIPRRNMREKSRQYTRPWMASTGCTISFGQFLDQFQQGHQYR